MVEVFGALLSLKQIHPAEWRRAPPRGLGPIFSAKVAKDRQKVRMRPGRCAFGHIIIASDQADRGRKLGRRGRVGTSYPNTQLFVRHGRSSYVLLARLRYHFVSHSIPWQPKGEGILAKRYGYLPAIPST